MTAVRLADLVGQPDVVAALSSAVAAAHGDPDASRAAMTHAWLFSGPAGSGRSTAARAFAAALQCPRWGCGSPECVDCRTAAAGTHPDVRVLSTAGLSIKVGETRALRSWMAEAPPADRWRIAVVEDADRLTPGAAAALLKIVEEPPQRGVFLLCTPSTHADDVPVTITSRCRVVVLGSPRAEDVAALLIRDGVAEDLARWAAAACGGHVGRARRLASDEGARRRRETALATATTLRTLGDCFTVVDRWLEESAAAVGALADGFTAEKAEWATALGTDATSRRTAGGGRSAAAVLRDVEDRQRLEQKRAERDALDLMLVDLAGYYRDVVAAALGRGRGAYALCHADKATQSADSARRWGPATALERLQTVLDTRLALEQQAKPRIALEAMTLSLYPS